MKKIVKVSLYWLLVRCKSSCNPSILAFPIFVRSRNAMRYKIVSHGMSFRSSFHNSLRSCKRSELALTYHTQNWRAILCVFSPLHSRPHPDQEYQGRRPEYHFPNVSRHPMVIGLGQDRIVSLRVCPCCHGKPKSVYLICQGTTPEEVLLQSK